MQEASKVIEDAIRGGLGKVQDKVGRETPIAIALDGLLEPKPAASILSTLVDLLKEGGGNPQKMTIIIGNGWRRRSNPDLIEAITANKGLRGLRVYEHNWKTRELKTLGSTSRGTEVSLNSLFTSAGLRIVVGESLPDALAGFKGPQSALIPGISSLKTVEMNRIHAFEEGVDLGRIHGNPLLEDLLEAAKLADVDLAINMVPTPDGGLLGVYVGGLEEAWKRALSDFGGVFRAKVEGKPDILVVSAGGYKHDHDLYSGIWALSGAKNLAERALAIILVAECSEGLGVEGLRTFSRVERVEELRGRYALGAEAVHLLRSLLRRCQIHMVSALPKSYLEPLGLRSSRTANDALASALEGRRGRKILVMPRGCITIPYLS